ncbi:GNAT family acetyltransferase [Paenibacillus antibioticophila]|uniref:GNAT family acetyltransferase n=1 Tax=Paenibacillus antibioticophila TaxID=1274374 RepID=A0A920CEN9_9BACL|nr:GNAT family N-acetyltransferase [Paenibacillus antibioticophila]GIO36805.1 GNAT family acetyltransferase [Paenibacillus antibioticophila]
MIHLKKLALEEPEGIYQMILEIGAGENGFVNSLRSSDFEEFKQKLKKNDDISNGINLKEGLVPQTIYWFYDHDRPVGYGKLRHKLNEKLLEHGGHIGYVIRPTARNRGYGKQALTELVKQAHLMGIKEILLTCDEANTASKRIIEFNGGVMSELKEGSCKYWIS